MSVHGVQKGLGSMDRDRNLLFGIFAVQLKKINPTQLIEAAAGWAVDPSRDLSQRLVEAGALSERDRAFVSRVVDEAIREHNGDAAATLQTFGGEEEVYVTYRGSIVLTESGGVSRADEAKTKVLGALPDSLPGVQEAPGRYTHLSEQGRGGMGRVLLVHDKHLGRDIALKELLPEPYPNGATDVPSPVRLSVSRVARFLQEARITSQLEHPSVVPVYELGYRKDGTLYYTMKLVRGRTLSQAIRQTRSLEERLKLLPHFLDLCQAIAYAHSRGVIHRDIKPGNVMVGEFGETVVLDWGVAKCVARPDVHADSLAETLQAMQLGDEIEVAKTAYGEVIGTPVYMPPEQAAGQLDRVDERSDVYSLGAVLYELLTGRVPFEGTSLRDTLKKICTENPVPIESIEAHAPSELIAICRRAMSKDPNDRYASARDLADDVGRFLSGAFVRAYEYSFVEYLGRLFKKHRTVALTVCVSVLVLVVVTVGYVVSITQANRRLEQARADERNQRVAAENAREQEKKQRALAERKEYFSKIHLAQNQLERRNYIGALRMLTATPESLRNWEWGRLRWLSYFKSRFFSDLTLTHVGGSLFSASFNPDASRIVTASADRTAKVWDALTGEELVTLFGHSDWVVSASFNSDGRWIVTASGDGTAKVWDTLISDDFVMLSGHNGAVLSASFSPNLKRIVTGSDDGTGKIWDTLTGEKLLTFSGHSGSLRSVAFSPDGGRVVTASADRTAKIWDTLTGEELLTFSGHTGAVLSASFSPDGRWVVTVSGDNTAKVWDASTGEEFVIFSGHNDWVNFGSFSSDSSRVVTGSDDRTAKIWDTLTGEELLTFSGHTGAVLSASFSPDGRWVVTASDDETAKVWDALTGDELLTLRGHSGPVRSALFSPDGSRIVTASYDKTAKVWDAITGEELVTLFGHSDWVWSASFSPGGTQIVTASFDKTARVWEAVPWGLEDLPGDSSMSLDERVEMWCRARISERKQAKAKNSSQ